VVQNAGTSPGAGVSVIPYARQAVATGRTRLPYLDNLRTAMVAWIIGGHAFLGYSAIGGWPYDEVHETTFATRTELALAAVLGPTAKAVLIAVLGVPASFWLGGQLVRTRMRQVL
jgi:hypothetical protein